MDANISESVVTYMTEKIDSINSRIEILEERHNSTLSDLRGELNLYKKLRQEACLHNSKKHIPDYNYHRNEDDSYDECNICGKHL